MFLYHKISNLYLCQQIMLSFIQLLFKLLTIMASYQQFCKFQSIKFGLVTKV